MPIRINHSPLFIRMLIMKTLPDYSTLDKSILPTHILPPKSTETPAFTMVLDLDETLVHCVMEPVAEYDKKFSVRQRWSCESRSHTTERMSMFTLYFDRISQNF